MDDFRIDPQVTLPGGDLSWTAVRASGKGGQNVNKVASKVELRFAFEQCLALPLAVKARLRQLAGSKITISGELIIISQKTRDQARNLDDALTKLRDLLLQALQPPKPRRATKPTYGSKKRRLADKKAHGDKKRQRGSGYE